VRAAPVDSAAAGFGRTPGRGALTPVLLLAFDSSTADDVAELVPSDLSHYAVRTAADRAMLCRPTGPAAATAVTVNHQGAHHGQLRLVLTTPTWLPRVIDTSLSVITHVGAAPANEFRSWSCAMPARRR